MRDDRGRLLDLREAIERIEKYTAAGRSALERDELIQTWVIYHLQIIGEAARALSPELRDRYAGVPWSEIVGMRNILDIAISALMLILSGRRWTTICRS